jgi:hypothetical protein
LRLKGCTFRTVGLQNAAKEFVLQLNGGLFVVGDGVVILLSASHLHTWDHLAGDGQVKWLNECKVADISRYNLLGDYPDSNRKGNAEDGGEQLADIGAIIFLIDGDALVEEGHEGIAHSRGRWLR